MILGVIVVAVDLSQTIGKNMSLPLYQNNQVQNVHIMYNSTVDYHWLEAFVRQLSSYLDIRGQVPVHVVDGLSDLGHHAKLLEGRHPSLKAMNGNDFGKRIRKNS